jgi:hypothetical protein
MQPAIREYYHLEEIWGGKPVKMKVGEVKHQAGEGQRARAGPRDGAGPRLAARKAGGKSAAKPAGKAPARQAAAGQAPAKTPRKPRRRQEGRNRSALSQERRKPAAKAAGGAQGGTAPAKPRPQGCAPPRPQEGRARPALTPRPPPLKLLVVAVGQRQPGWADEAWADFAKRFPPEMRLELKALKAEPRQGGKTAAQCMAAEASASRPPAQGRAPRVLDERGSRLTTAQLAERLRFWRG